MFHKGDRVKLISGLSALDNFMGIKVGDVGECVVDSYVEKGFEYVWIKFEHKSSPDMMLCERLELVKANDNISLEEYIEWEYKTITSMRDAFGLKSDFCKGYCKALEDVKSLLKEK